ncbi:MAG: PAS domain S-box protein [Chloroflexaceae bacterium]|jgi:PAS domain S-box-containing protein|nr:PAS domain S-box protein [Chloroflexaceae bacterium]
MTPIPPDSIPNVSADYSDALRQANHRLQQFFDVSPLATIEFDLEGTILHWNRAAEHIFGWASAEAIGKNIFTLLVPDVAWEHVQGIMQVLLGSQAVDSRNQNVRKDGTMITCQWHNAVLYDADGQMTGILSQVSDVSEQLRAEEKLRTNQHMLQSLINNFPGAIYRYTTTPTWQMTFMSERVQDMLGQPAHMFIAQGDTPAALQFNQFIHAEDRTAVLDTVHAALAQQHPFEITYRVIDAQGREKWLWERGQGVFDEQGTLIAIDGFINDVSTQRQVETELRWTQELFSSMINTLPGAVYRCANDAIWTAEYISEGALDLYGYPAKAFLEADEDSKRRYIGDMIHREDSPWIVAAVEQALAERRPFEIIYRIIDKHGRLKWFWERGRGRFDAHGTLLSIDGFISDYSLQKQAEEERNALQEQVIAAQEATLRELGTPIIPLANGIIAMPLIGGIDSNRAQQVIESLLEGVNTHRATVAILDITGVPVVDTQVASALLRAAQAVKLLGAQVVLTGIRPEVAQTMVGLGLDMGDIATRATLQDGISFATQRKREGTKAWNLTGG